MKAETGSAKTEPHDLKSRLVAMMNGRGVRSYLVRRDRDDRGSQSIDAVPSTVQFDESSDEYRCLCNCFHIKTGTYIIAVVHTIMILFFLIHTFFVYFEHDARYYQAAKIKHQEKYVFGSFVAELVGLGIGAVALLLLVIAVTKNIAGLVIPHIVVQVFAILCFILLLVSGVVAICTDSATFYRFLNAAAFRDHPNQSTVRLETATTVRIYSMLVVYGISLFLELWFIIVIYNCYRYLQERSAYMRYCMAFSTPMKTLSAR